MAAETVFACLVIATFATSVNCYCLFNSTLKANSCNATFKTSMKSVSFYSNNELEEFYIQPGPQLPYWDYFLEIRWSPNFDVRGDMPDCKEDYVEVFISRSLVSIGKFCSNNIDSNLFTMYSPDGFAKITFLSNERTTGEGFTFFYQLKQRSLNSLGFPQSTICENTLLYGSSGVIYSTGWPIGYKKSASPCEYHILRGHYYGVKLSFMDVDLGSRQYDDKLNVIERTDYSYQTDAVNTHKNIFTKYESRVIVKLMRNIGSVASYRGFVAGYIMFRKENAKSHDQDDSENSPIITILTVIGVIACLGGLIVCFVKIYVKCQPPVQIAETVSLQSADSNTLETTHRPLPGPGYTNDAIANGAPPHYVATVENSRQSPLSTGLAPPPYHFIENTAQFEESPASCEGVRPTLESHEIRGSGNQFLHLDATPDAPPPSYEAATST